MKRCEEFEDALWEETQTPDLTAHLAECADCRALAEAREGFAVLQRVKASDPRGALRARRGMIKRRRGYAFALAAGVCVVAAIVFLAAQPRKVSIPRVVVRPAPWAPTRYKSLHSRRVWFRQPMLRSG